MLIGIVKESHPGERRVALDPASAARIVKEGLSVKVETGAGADAGFPDEQYAKAGAEIAESRVQVLETADVLCQVRTPGASPEAGRADLEHFGERLTVIGLAEPLSAPAPIEALAASGVRTFAMELMPRITRAQSMDVLSSQATIAGYKAVLLAASFLPKMFPMMMTAAGTLAPARVFVIGAGVAGLQAIASSRRLGAVVSGYDIRPAVKEQVESLGAKFIEIEIDAGMSEDKGGYARAMDDAFYRKQRELMATTVAANDVVITTAAVPGRKSPVLVTAEMVKVMPAGSVIVDLAAERGGNCELTRADETVSEHGVTILGPTSLPSTVPNHASQMYARNVLSFLLHIVKDGELRRDADDEIIQDTLLTEGGQIVHNRVREALGLAVESTEAAETPGAGAS